MEKLSCPIRVLWELYRSPMGTLSSSIKFMWDLYLVLQGPYGQIILSYGCPMGALWEPYIVIDNS